MTRGEGGGEDLRLRTGIGPVAIRVGGICNGIGSVYGGGGEIGRLEGRGILKVTIEMVIDILGAGVASSRYLFTSSGGGEQARRWDDGRAEPVKNGERCNLHRL